MWNDENRYKNELETAQSWMTVLDLLSTKFNEKVRKNDIQKLN